MSNTQQPQPAGTGAVGAEAAAELAEIQRRQEQVIKAVLVPVWYWWVIAAAIIAIAASLSAAHAPYPVTIGCAAGAAVLVIVGPLVNQYVRRLMLSQAGRN